MTLSASTEKKCVGLPTPVPLQQITYSLIYGIKRSRLIVKNLPSYVSEKRLRDHFASQRGGATITDVKLVHRPDGTFRRFAFIGFKTEEEASKAREYFNNTYIDSSRINVSAVQPVRLNTFGDCCMLPIGVSMTSCRQRNGRRNAQDWKILTLLPLLPLPIPRQLHLLIYLMQKSLESQTPNPMKRIRL